MLSRRRNIPSTPAPDVARDTLYPYLSPSRNLSALPQQPDGEFCIPLVTTKERLQQLLRVLRAGAESLELQFAGDHSIDLLAALSGIQAVCETCEDVPPPLPKVIVKKERLKAKWGELKITDEGLDIWDCGQDVVINICTPCED